MDKLILLAVITLVVFGALWLGAAYYNYTKAIRLVKDFIEKENHYIQLEQQATSTQMGAEAFVERMKLKDSYQSIYEMTKMFKEDEENFRSWLKKIYLSYGFRYNLISIKK